MSLIVGKKEEYRGKKSLVVYFSREDENYFEGTLKYIDKGNTEIIAQYIQELTNADLFKVEPKDNYSVEYKKCLDEAKERIRTHNAPIKEELPDISQYDVIFVGSPIYFGGMPEELFTALKGKDYTGKIIRPFTTHEGSGISGVPMQLDDICKGAKITMGLAIRGSQVNNAKDRVKEWV